MKDRTISTDELRVSFSKVLEAMKRRQSLVLTYRNVPLARIEPIEAPDRTASADDPFFRLAAYAEPCGAFDSENIDQEVYDP